jgi:hypothetical protein
MNGVIHGTGAVPSCLFVGNGAVRRAEDRA